MNTPITREQRIHLVAGFVFFYGLAVIMQCLGNHFTFPNVQTWYPTLNKSPLTPPGMWFGIVWTTLYFLMALAATRVFHITGQLNSRPLRWWYIQLIAGLVWSGVFFHAKHIAGGMAVIAFVWLAVLLAVLQFWRVNRTAGLVMLPLLAWVSFASYLNFYILQNN